jgi:hypothetical protein
MITRALEKYKVSTTNQAVTSYAGLPLLLGMAKSLGLEEKLNGLPVKERAAGLPTGGNDIQLDGVVAIGWGGVGRYRSVERGRGIEGAVGEIPGGEYGGRISEAVREFIDTPAGTNPIGDGGEGDPSGGVEIGGCGRGRLFSGVTEIGGGDELRRGMGVYPRGGDVRGAEDASGGIISAWERIADGEFGRSFGSNIWRR